MVFCQGATMAPNSSSKSHAKPLYSPTVNLSALAPLDNQWTWPIVLPEL